MSLQLRCRLQHRLHDAWQEAEGAVRRIWSILCSVYQVHLWTERNTAFFREELISPLRSAIPFWECGIRQLQAISLRKLRSAENAAEGPHLHACIELIVREHTRHSSALELRHEEVSSLARVSWLRTL